MNETSGQPPSSLDSEHAVLGALLLAPEALTDLNLSANDFYSATNRSIFLAIQSRAEKGLPFDAVTLGDDFAGNESIHPAYLVELASTVPSAANIKGYAETVRDKAVRRQLIEIGTQQISKAHNCAEPADTIADSMSMLALAASRATPSDTEPLDLFGDQPFPVLDMNDFPPVIADYVKDQAAIVGMAPEMMAFGCLVTAAAATHDGIVIQPKPNERWTQRACLWLMVVAPPGNKKSTSISKPQAPLKSIQARMGQDYDKNLAEYIKADKLCKAREKAAIAAEAKGAVSGYSEPEKTPERPPDLRVFINNATPESLGELLRDNPRGLLWSNDEMAIWFGLHDAYSKGAGGVARAIGLQAYDGGEYTFDRIGRGRVRVPNLSYSLIGTTQPAKIKETVSGMSDDGLLQRMMVIEIPNQSLYGDEERTENVSYRRNYESAIETIWARKPPEGGQVVVQLSPGANRIRADFYTWATRVASTEGLPDMLRGHLSKWDALWARLALTFHSIGTATGGLWIGDHAVSERTAARVTKIMKTYLLPQALRFYTDTVSNSDPVYSMAQKVGGMILSQGMLRITNRELQRGLNGWRTAQEWQKTGVLTLLRESGWLIGADSRRTTGADSGWAVNPRVHVLFGRRAAAEQARRAESAETMKALRDAAAGRG